MSAWMPVFSTSRPRSSPPTSTSVKRGHSPWTTASQAIPAMPRADSPTSWRLPSSVEPYSPRPPIASDARSPSQSRPSCTPSTTPSARSPSQSRNSVPVVVMPPNRSLIPSPPSGSDVESCSSACPVSCPARSPSGGRASDRDRVLVERQASRKESASGPSHGVAATVPSREDMRSSRRRAAVSICSARPRACSVSIPQNVIVRPPSPSSRPSPCAPRPRPGAGP